MRLFFCWAACLLLFSACAPTRYPPGHHSSTPASSTSKQPDNPHLGEGGKVKRGNPYQIAGIWYYPLASGAAYDETGIASWYGKKFHGLKTANGETYNMYAMTAAHTTLPMPSVVKVTNLENGKSIRVRVNDRGPFVKSRLIDLSFAAAQALGYDQQGTTRVRVQTIHSADVSQEVVKPRPQSGYISAAEPKVAPVPVAAVTPINQTTTPTTVQETPAVPEMAYVQVGAFSSKTSANNIAQDLKKDVAHASAQVIPVGSVFRVRLGPFDLDEDAQVALQSVRNHGYPEAMIIHD